MLVTCRRNFLHGCAASLLAAAAWQLPRGMLANDGSATIRNGSEPRWPIEFQEGNLVFHCDFDVRQRGQLVDDLMRLREDIAEQLSLRIETEPIHLLLFGNATNYRGYMRAYFPDIPERRALFIKRRGPGMVFAYDSRSLETDLRHETTHALLNASLAYVPLWLDEGLAEYFEVPGGQRDKAGEHMRMVRWRATLGHIPDVERLDSIGDLAAMGAGEYRDAWSWVHFLLHFNTSTAQCLKRFLQDIQSGLPPGPFTRRLAAEIPDANQWYLQHFRRW
jgi:hypothetical protein